MQFDKKTNIFYINIKVSDRQANIFLILSPFNNTSQTDTLANHLLARRYSTVNLRMGLLPSKFGDHVMSTARASSSLRETELIEGE